MSKMIDKIVEMNAPDMDPEQSNRIHTMQLMIEKRVVRPV